MSGNLARGSIRDPAHDLLFGMLALQNNFISRNALVAAFGAWVSDRSKPLDQILLARADLDANCHALLGALVRQHLKVHGENCEKSLTSLSTTASVLDRLLEIADPELSANVQHIGVSGRDDHDNPLSEATTTLGTPTSAGGRFHVLRLHALGGLGEVYVARDDEVHREVALKQMRDDHADDPQSRARFLLEAEITGGLEHPGIVPVYGLGAHDDGRPFYVMRFVRGESLKGAIAQFHADKATQMNQGLRTLALQKLLRRFLDVCNAISYAHSRGVLHRDLKPGNIMLGNYGETLVVDWGLAKAVGNHLDHADPPGSEPTLRPESGSDVQPTVMGSRLGTPAYMPPEQAAGRINELGAPSDVYSLGATLYVLLTGRAPFVEPDLPELIRQLERGEFPQPRQIRSWIDRDLEAICLKAMALKQHDRYVSPRAMAEDIEHWLADEPVTARRESLWARSWRLMRKHRTMSTSAAVIVVLSAVALAVGLQRERQSAALIAAESAAAERRLDQVMTSYEDYFTGFNEQALHDRVLPPSLLESLLARPRAFYARLNEELAAKPNPSTKERALLAQGRYTLGRIFLALGRHDESEREIDGAARLYERLAQEDPGDSKYQQALAGSYINLGLVVADGSRHSEAEKAYHKAITTLERLVLDQPSIPGHQDFLANGYNGLAVALAAMGRRNEAEKAHDKALVCRERLVKDHPGVPDFGNDLCNDYHNLGMFLADSNRPAESEAMYRKAIAARERLVRNYPGKNQYVAGLAGDHENVGILLATIGRRADAVAAYTTAVAAFVGLITSHPGVLEYRTELASTYHNLGTVLADMGRGRRGGGGLWQGHRARRGARERCLGCA